MKNIKWTALLTAAAVVVCPAQGADIGLDARAREIDQRALKIEAFTPMCCCLGHPS